MRISRKILYPFALIYGGITWVRNFFYNARILKSQTYDLPVICVGNLNTGGTGKSPMIEYLLNLLLKEFRAATLSRGYKRKTKGFILLTGSETAREVGDEPLQFKQKYKEALVAVDADRRNGISKLIAHKAEVILLDDAFQHRKVKAGFNILLTTYNDLYVKDFMLPAGNLREPTVGAERARVIVVTKCPYNLARTEQEEIRRKLKLRNYQQLYFSYISYEEKLKSKNGTLELENFRQEDCIVVTGIANPEPFVKHVKAILPEVRHLKYPDHHNFSQSEIRKLKQHSFIITTEKDYIRLKDYLDPEKLYFLSMKLDFINNKTIFDNKIMSFINDK